MFFLWDGNISKGTTLRSTKASYTLNSSSRAVTISMNTTMLPKRHRWVTAEIHALPLTLRRLLWNNSRSNQNKYHLNSNEKKILLKQDKCFAKERSVALSVKHLRASYIEYLTSYSKLQKLKEFHHESLVFGLSWWSCLSLLGD